MPISIAIPTIGRTECLAALLVSLRGARGIADTCEIIVAFTHSGDARDETVTLCESFGVRLIEAALSASAKRNALLRIASFPVVLFLDDDCLADSELLAAYRRALEDVTDEHGACLAGRVVFDHADTLAWRLMTRTSFVAAFDPTTRTDVEWATTANLLVPRQAALACGGFDEDFPVGAGGEDVDFCLRFCAAGGRILPVRDATVTHSTATWRTLSSNVRRMWCYGRAEAHLLRRHPARRRGFAYYGPLSLLGAMAVIIAFPSRAPHAALAYVGLHSLVAVAMHRSVGRQRSWRDALLAAAADAYYWVYGCGYLVQSAIYRKWDALFVGFKYRESGSAEQAWRIQVKTLVPALMATAAAIAIALR